MCASRICKFFQNYDFSIVTILLYLVHCSYTNHCTGDFTSSNSIYQSSEPTSDPCYYSFTTAIKGTEIKIASSPKVPKP